MSKATVPLKELGEFKNGANYPKGSYGAGNKIVNVKDLFRGRFVPFEGLDELKPGTLKNKDIYLVEDGDLLFTRSSLVKSGSGMVAMINNPLEDILFCGFIIRLRPNKSKVFPLYLLYLLRSPKYRKLFTDSAVQTNISNINQETLGGILIDLPDLPTQQKIAAALSALDAKIELNQRINAELESMAKTLYDYWFVQFAPHKSAGGKMVWNDELKREIPLGWEVVELGDFVNIFDSKRIPLSNAQREGKQGQYPYFGATGIMDYVNDYIFDGEYLLIAEDGSVMGDDGLAIVQYIWGKTWVNNHAHVLQPKDSSNKDYLYFLLKSISVIQIMTGSIQKKITQDNLLGVKFPLPPENMLKQFSEFAKPIRQRKIKLVEESQTLTDLRDWLLPMLMNGQVQVK